MGKELSTTVLRSNSMVLPTIERILSKQIFQCNHQMKSQLETIDVQSAQESHAGRHEALEDLGQLRP